MPSEVIKKHKHELNVLSSCNSSVFKALVNSNKEIVQSLLEILDNVANIRLDLNPQILEKLLKKHQFFEAVLSVKSIRVSRNLILRNIKTTQLAIQAALPVINND